MSRESWMSYEEYSQYVMVDLESLGDTTDYLGYNEEDPISEDLAQRVRLSHEESQRNKQGRDFFERFYGAGKDVLKTSSLVQQPAILFPRPVYTGIQVINQIIYNHTKDNPFTYQSGRDFILKNSQLMTGTITKKHLGGLFSALL